MKPWRKEGSAQSHWSDHWGHLQVSSAKASHPSSFLINKAQSTLCREQCNLFNPHWSQCSYHERLWVYLLLVFSLFALWSLDWWMYHCHISAWPPPPLIMSQVSQSHTGWFKPVVPNLFLPHSFLEQSQLFRYQNGRSGHLCGKDRNNWLSAPCGNATSADLKVAAPVLWVIFTSYADHLRLKKSYFFKITEWTETCWFISLTLCVQNLM